MGRYKLAKGFVLILIVVLVLYGTSFNTSYNQKYRRQWLAQKEEYGKYTGHIVEEQKKSFIITDEDILNMEKHLQTILQDYEKDRQLDLKTSPETRKPSTFQRNISVQSIKSPEVFLRKSEDPIYFQRKTIKARKRTSVSVPGTLNVHIWEGWCGSRIEDLKRNRHFPLYPSVKANLTRFFAQWFETGYGERIFGYLHPPETGNYTFAVSCDDNCEVWLSNSSSPKDIKQIVSVGTAKRPANTKVADFKQFKSQISKQIYLVKGDAYYIEALHKQAANNDHILLTWLAPSWPRIRTISSEYVSSYISDVDCSNDVNEYARCIPETKACDLNSSAMDENTIYWFNRSRFQFGIKDVRDRFHYHVLHDNFDEILPEIDYKPSYKVEFIPKRYEGVKFIHEISVYPNDHTELTHMTQYEYCEQHRFFDSHYKMLRTTVRPTTFIPWEKIIKEQNKKKKKHSYKIYTSNNSLPNIKHREEKRNKTEVSSKNYYHLYLNHFKPSGNILQRMSSSYIENNVKRQKGGLKENAYFPSLSVVNENNVDEAPLQETKPYENNKKIKFIKEQHKNMIGAKGEGKGYVRLGRKLFSFKSSHSNPKNSDILNRPHSYPGHGAEYAKTKSVLGNMPYSEIFNNIPVLQKYLSNGQAIYSNNKIINDKSSPVDNNGHTDANKPWRIIKSSHPKKEIPLFEDEGLPVNALDNYKRKRPIYIPNTLSDRLIELQNKLAHRNSINPNRYRKNIYTGSYAGDRHRRAVSLSGRIPPKLTRKIYFLNGKASMANVSLAHNAQMIRLYDIFGPAIYYLGQSRKREFSWIYNSFLSDCKSDGNVQLSENVAKSIVNKYVKAIQKKHGRQYTLKRIVNVEENHDVLKGNRYLIELELCIKSQNNEDKIIQLSKYVYEDISFGELYYPKDFQWNPHATVHIIVPVKDQGRWVQHFIDNMEEIALERNDPHVNVIIVDFSSCDIDIERSLKQSKLKRYEVIRLHGPFQRALGIQAGTDAVKNPEDIIFTCDLHLVIPSQLIDSIRKHTIKGKMAFAPMVHRLSCGYTPELPYGLWEIQGYGLFAISKFDYDRIGGMNTKEFKTKWGGEDWEFLDRTLAHGLEVERLRIPKFYHYYHSKKGMWITPSVSSLKQEYNL